MTPCKLFCCPAVFFDSVQIQRDIPFFQRFEDGWLIRDATRTYLSNEQTRRRADEKAEKQAATAEGGDVASEDEPPRKKLKTHRKQVGESEEEDADDEVEKPVKTTLANKKPQKKKTVKVVLSDPDVSDDNDLDILMKDVKKLMCRRFAPAQVYAGVIYYPRVISSDQFTHWEAPMKLQWAAELCAG
ncbi:hypothetical protein B0H13DRAFT_1875993 [Mycena leptocephala]|nr:hypothetical protein B0H13DRAFT_1875993 [Mycena leptocephala]